MRIRIEAVDLPGSQYGVVGVQRGREVVHTQPAGASSARWDLDAGLAVTSEGALDLRGPYVHGRRGDRFLYVAWGQPGADGSLMYRRAKLMLDVVEQADLERADVDDHVLVARLGLTGPDGTPRCAAVRPPDITWSVERLATG